MIAEAPRRVVVWDLPIRLFHWTLVLLFALCWASGKMGKLDLHMKAGSLILALLLFRLAWGVLGSHTARFRAFVTGPAGILGYLKGNWRGIGHNPLGALSVLAMLGLLVAQAASGLFASDDIATDGPLAWLATAKTVKLLSTVHRLGAWGLLALVAAHLSAIIFYRVVRGKNLVVPMIGGLGPAEADLDQPPLVNPRLALGLFLLAAALVFGGLAVWGK